MTNLMPNVLVTNSSGEGKGGVEARVQYVDE